jgi:hypothetical protein
MPEWRDGQPICGAYYKTGCANELKIGARVVLSSTNLYYCSDKCCDAREGKSK